MDRGVEPDFDVPRSLVEALARHAVGDVAPEELLLFDQTAEQYFADPEGAVNPKHRDEALGFGLDLAMLTPYVLAVATSCLGFLVKTVAETATSEATKPAIGDMLRRLTRRGPQDPEGPVRLSGEQAEGVRAIAFGRAKDLGLSEERARVLADAVVGGLNVVG
jgi:hypothetical protein